MKIWTMVIGMTVIAAVMVSPAMAYREWREICGSETGRVNDITAMPGLKLTTEQGVKINALRQSHLEEIRLLLDEMTDKNRKMRALWLAPQPDQKRIEVLQAEARKLLLRLTDRFKAYRREVYRELTPDQRQRVQNRDIGQAGGRMDLFGMDGRSRGGFQREKSRMQDRGMGVKVP